ncbi:hypothetical protein ZIOFF_072601 [Zingiber officinale]|uniref:Polygalacturonase n=1 Tax=Zingiber officinale TaxID=94328 RepID=A0A8J5C6D0_ZINOF|nr:hypothetical protein ZIOFF_072601 [Zingiber officinale]
MAGQSVIVISLFVLLLLASSSAATEVLADPSIYNVLDFGAKGDGNTNDTLAFVKAWSAACHNSKTPSTLLIPAGKTFLLSHINFEGPCNNFIYVMVEGNLKRTNEIWPEASGWLLFIQIKGIKISGSGELDGQGANWWSCNEKNNLHMLGCTDAQILGLRSINSPMMHISVGNSERVNISDITIIAPENSPNTDGIHVQESRFVDIRNSIIGTGDDCVSLSEGDENIFVNNGGSGFAKNISFVNIIMNDVLNPIIIDQYYCPDSFCDASSSGVEVIDVKYIGVTGTSSSEVAIALNCSQSVPCSGIVMDTVNLSSANKGGKVQSYCISANGYTKNQVTPAVSCLTQ